MDTSIAVDFEYDIKELIDAFLYLHLHGKLAQQSIVPRTTFDVCECDELMNELVPGCLKIATCKVLL